MVASAPGFLRVRPAVANNPVARAIQRQRIASTTRDFQIRLHMLRDGELVHADVMASAKVVAVAIGVLELQHRTDCPAWRVMHGGLSTLLQVCSRKFKWRQIDATPIGMALEHAASVLALAPAAMVHRAWVDSERLQAEAAGT